MSIAYQILFTAGPALLIGYGAFALELYDPTRKSFWRWMTAAFFGAALLFMIVGLLWLIWS